MEYVCFQEAKWFEWIGGGEIVEKLRTKRPHCKIIKDSLLRRFSFFWFKFVLLITQWKENKGSVIMNDENVMSWFLRCGLKFNRILELICFSSTQHG